jgi:hypothetical protein
MIPSKYYGVVSAYRQPNFLGVGNSQATIDRVANHHYGMVRGEERTG